MGEKIRDLQPITIGNAELMIELNEGYTKNEGRLIHIQNKHFRYLLKEKEFLKLSGAVLRSKRELDYIKSDENVKKIQPISINNMGVSERVKDAEKRLAEKLLIQQIRYRIVSEGAQFFTVLINQADRRRFLDFCVSQDLKKMDHPYTEKAGYIYLYQMNPFMLFYFEDIYIEVYFQLPCRSLTEKTWIPLDRSIQSHIWEVEETKNGCYILDPASKIIFLCGWSIFNTHVFSEFTKQYIRDNRDYLYNELFANLLSTVFFSFSETMLSMLINEQYDEIIKAYYQFCNY